MIICLECRTITDDDGPARCPGCGNSRIKTSKLDDFFRSSFIRHVRFDFLPDDSPDGFDFLFRCRSAGII